MCDRGGTAHQEGGIQEGSPYGEKRQLDSVSDSILHCILPPRLLHVWPRDLLRPVKRGQKRLLLSSRNISLSLFAREELLHHSGSQGAGVMEQSCRQPFKDTQMD